MKMVMIAALVAAPLSAAAGPAWAAEPPSQNLVSQEDGRSQTRAGDGVRLDLDEAQAVRADAAPESHQAAAAQADRPKKHKSTGDKVLTGAAVVLGVGAVAVGALLVAIFVS
jgi:hypothetical protein